MSRLLILFIGISFLGGWVNAQQKNKVVYGTFEDAPITDMILNIFSKDYDALVFKKFDSIDLVYDKSLNSSLPKEYFDTIDISSFNKMNTKNIPLFTNVFRTKAIYFQGRVINKKLTQVFECSDVGSYNILIILSSKHGVSTKLMLSTTSRRFCLFYQFEREIFILYDSCINDIGWDRINKLLKESGQNW